MAFRALHWYSLVCWYLSWIAQDSLLCTSDWTCITLFLFEEDAGKKGKINWFDVPGQGFRLQVFSTEMYVSNKNYFWYIYKYMQYIYIHKIVCYLDLDCKSQGALSTSQSSLECFCVRRQGATRKRETERVRDYNYHMKIWVVVLDIFDFHP